MPPYSLVEIYQITRRYISENRILHIVLLFTKRSHDNLEIEHSEHALGLLNWDVKN
jgi:hypothetical protein